MIASLIGGGIIGLIVGYHVGVWHGIVRLGNAERKQRLGRIGFPFKSKD